MPRIRGIKPDFFLDDKINEQKPLIRLAFMGLWCYADREGRLEDCPKKLKFEILPYDDCNMESILCILDNNGFIKRYSINGKNYIWIVNFTKHQRPHHTESESVIPPFDGSITVKQPLNNGESLDDTEKVKEKEKEKEKVDAFEKFWNLYPNKKAKPKALISFKKLSESEINAISAALPRHISSDQWTRDEGKYIPYPSTWLNERRWEDQIGSAKKTLKEQFANIRSL